MSRTQSFVAFGLALVSLAGTPAVFAQNLEMTQPPAATTNVAAPGRGMTMTQVEKQFGAPSERYAAVGQPPIRQLTSHNSMVGLSLVRCV